MVDGKEIEPGLIAVSRLEEKPKEFPTNLAIRGRYVLSREIFDLLDVLKNDTRKEVQLTDAIKVLAEEGKVYAHLNKGKIHDIGDPKSYIEALTSIGMKIK